MLEIKEMKLLISSVPVIIDRNATLITRFVQGQSLPRAREER